MPRFADATDQRPPPRPPPWRAAHLPTGFAPCVCSSQRRHLALQHFLRELLDEKVLSSSPELCAFLECEAAAQLAIGINHVSTCASVFYSELQREEAQRAEVGAALQQARTEKLWAYHEKEVAEHAASKAREEAARAHAGAHKARVQILKMLLAGRNQRLQQGALSKLRAYRYEPGDDLVAAEVEKSLSELAAAALEEGIAPIAESPEEEEEQQQQTAECRRDDAKDQNDQNENAPPADASLQTPRRSDEETLIKWGSLLKQGAGNRRYQGRYFELIRAAGREKAKAQNVLVYYADARKESVKGYIPLENATVEAVADEHYESIQHRLRISTPVQPLGDLLKNPKNGRSPLKVLDNMNIFQKIDTWGKSAFRSAIAISSSKVRHAAHCCALMAHALSPPPENVTGTFLTHASDTRL